MGNPTWIDAISVQCTKPGYFRYFQTRRMGFFYGLFNHLLDGLSQIFWRLEVSWDHQAILNRGILWHCMSLSRFSQKLNDDTMWGPRMIAKLVNITPITMVYGLQYLQLQLMGWRIIERKLRRTKVRLFTVPCCSIILFSSEGMKKKCIWSSSYFFFVVL